MSYTKLDFAQTKSLIDTNKELLILDVREEDEYITGHLADAVLFTLAEINEASAREIIPAKKTPLLVYCRSGRRSKAAADILMALGYETIYDAGGLMGWPYGLE